MFSPPGRLRQSTTRAGWARFKPIPPVAGDVNGDGVPDFIVGAFNDDPAGSGSDAGSAYVFSGADSSLLYQVTGDTVADNLGHSRFRGW